MKHKALTSVVVAAAALLGAAACTDDGDDGGSIGDDVAGAIDSADEETGDGTADDTGTGDGDTGDGETGDGGGTDDGGDDAAAGRPQDATLDTEVRHPSGIVLRVNGIAFEGDDVVLDTEVVNSSRETVTFHQGNWASDRLRLVDDAGQEYNFIETVQDEAIELAPGENLSGTMAFRGPLLDQPEEIRLVTNVLTEHVDEWSIDEESDSAIYPAFVVPIEVSWS